MEWSSRQVGQRRLILLGLACFLVPSSPASAFQGGCATEWISKTPAGQPASGDSADPVLSADARFVAFVSVATNLVPGDTNFEPDVFVVDRRLNTIERVSVGTGDVQGNGGSWTPDISGDGRYVVFISKSTNWDPRDIHPAWDVYLRDRLMKTTELITVPLAPPTSQFKGSGLPRISPDGRYVVFHHGEDNLVLGDSNGAPDVFLHDRTTSVTELVSIDAAGVQSDWDSAVQAISADGRFVAFVSLASNWYPGNPAIPVPKPYLYVRDRLLKTLIPVNLNTQGSLGPGWADWKLDLSDDGRYLAYVYWWPHDDLPPMMWTRLFVRDLVTGVTEPISSVFGNNGSIPEVGVAIWNMSLSADGRFVAFASDYDEYMFHSGNTGGINVFLHDRLTGLTQVASLDPNGEWPSHPVFSSAIAYQASISSDGTTVAFAVKDPSFGSGSASIFHIHLRTCDWTQPQVYCDSQPNSQNCRPSVSFSGSPSAGAGSGFTLQAEKLIGKTPGLFFYSTRRPILTPFLGSYLCMEWPIKNMPAQSTGGSTPASCTGSLSVDFNAWISSGADPSLVAGENVCIQAWTRDAGATYGSNLSNAVAYVIGP
jgi:Tol biopolymer transport system component